MKNADTNGVSVMSTCYVFCARNALRNTLYRAGSALTNKLLQSILTALFFCVCAINICLLSELLTYSRNVSALLCVLILMFGFVLFQVRRWEIYAL